jgi:Fur family peroxide stress response transcriptional regulator
MAAVKKAGTKLTHQRLEIFKELAGSVDHPDAETIYKSLHGRLPTVSLDTVYRTLWKLEELGVVDTLGPRHESVRFDANTAEHHHYVCVRCGLARDFTSTELNALNLPETVHGFGSVLSKRVEVRGICAGCARELEAGSA